MGILTTCIGAYPKPAYTPIVDWFAPEFGANTSRVTILYKELMETAGDRAEDLLVTATREVIQDQVEAGIDIPTDGEVRRENYIHYHKAYPQAYFDLAEALDAAPIDQISIEDAHRPNDLALLERFAGSTVILGVVAVAQSRVETIDEIRQRLLTALNYIDRHRLIAAPDCGLGLLGRDLAIHKLTNLCEAAHSV